MRLVFFFFQAEDGIRDVAVTGVQTCALPIFRGQPAPTDIDVVPHLMRKDESSKANAKASSVQRPINTHKSKEAEDELQFEKRQEKRLAFRQNNGDGGERPELPGPGVALLRRSYACGKF